jgi:hypothetical protein
MARSYAILIGALLTLVGVLGFVRGEVGITLMGMSLKFSQINNIVHLASGLIGLALGFASWSYARAFARVFGVMYTLVAVFGFAHMPDFVVTTLDLNWNYNAIHLMVGLFGLLVGFSDSDSDAIIRARIKSYRRR